MSRLFREMQAATNDISGRSGCSPALTELLDVVGSTEDSPPPNKAALLQCCRRIELPPMNLPVLLPTDEMSATHSGFESYRSLRTKLTRFQATKGVRSVAISSAVGGDGKTISALNLAISLAQLESQRVLLIDGDIRTSGLSTLVASAQFAGLAEVLSGQAPFEGALASTSLPRLYMVSAGEPMIAASDLFAGPKWKEFMGWCNELFDMIIVDCPPILGLADFDLMSSACDGVLIVVRAGKTKLEAVTEIARRLPDNKLLGVILNGQEKQRRNHYNNYYYSHGKGTNGRA